MPSNPQTLEEAQAELDAAQAEPPTHYHVLMPNAAFEGKRYRFEFHHGECIIGANATVEFDSVKSAHPVKSLAREIFAEHLHYEVVPHPPGEPLLPLRGGDVDD